MRNRLLCDEWDLTALSVCELGNPGSARRGSQGSGDEETDLPGSSKFLPVKLSSPGPLSTQGNVTETLEAEIGEALALGVLSKCSRGAEGREMSLFRIIFVGQAWPRDAGDVSLPLPVGDPLGSVFPQHGCAFPGLAEDL